MEKRDWIIPANPSVYDAVSAFRKLKTLDWHKSRMMRNMQVEDTAYIYISKSIKMIKFKCVVTKSEVHGLEIDDEIFYVDKSLATKDGEFIELTMLCEYPDTESLSLERLRENGIKGNIQCTQKILTSVSDYIESVL